MPHAKATSVLNERAKDKLVSNACIDAAPKPPATELPQMMICFRTHSLSAGVFIFILSVWKTIIWRGCRKRNETVQREESLFGKKVVFWLQFSVGI